MSLLEKRDNSQFSGSRIRRKKNNKKTPYHDSA